MLGSAESCEADSPTRYTCGGRAVRCRGGEEDGECDGGTVTVRSVTIRYTRLKDNIPSHMSHITSQ